jgi:hypothetical protein
MAGRYFALITAPKMVTGGGTGWQARAAQSTRSLLQTHHFRKPKTISMLLLPLQCLYLVLVCAGAPTSPDLLAGAAPATLGFPREQLPVGPMSSSRPTAPATARITLHRLPLLKKYPRTCVMRIPMFVMTWVNAPENTLELGGAISEM